jgi:HlyD family secretion protein
MKRKRFIFIFGLVIVMLAAVGFTLGVFNGKGQAEPSGPFAGKTGVVMRRDLGSVVLATGIIKPCVGAEVRVGSRVSGIVKRLHVRIGDFVEKGQLLGELDPTESRALYNQALANLENAKAGLNYAALALKRQKALIAKYFTSRNRVDEAKLAYEAAVSGLKQAKANLDYTEIQLDYTRIRAPITGVVAAVSTQEGETVAASFAAPTFVVIIDLTRLEVQAYVDETDIGRISPGQRVTFTVDTYPGIDFEGKVTAVYPKAEMRDNVVNYITLIDITGKKGLTLRPEMTATVKIYQDPRIGVLVIPKQALRREGGKKYVYTVKQDRAVKQRVETGWSDGQYIEITRGLGEDEKIIIAIKEDYKW